MYYEKRQLILIGLAAILLGGLLRSLYAWIPNAATALVSPIRDSVWEQVKIIFWPYLLAALWLTRGRPGGIRPWLLTQVLLCLLVLAVGYGYHILLGGEAQWVDLSLSIAAMGLGIWLPTQFSGPFDGIRWAIPVALSLLFGTLVVIFTLWPPAFPIFVDLLPAGAFVPMPC